MKNIYTLCALTIFALSSTSSASFLDFTGWDHAQIIGGGQLFEDICDDVDVVVTGSGTNEVFSTVDGDLNIRSGADTGSASFTFTFSEPVDLTYELQSLDPLETITFTADTTPVYTHVTGAMPTQSGALTLMGNAFGLGPAGASRGLIDMANTTSFTWDYSSFNDNKFEWFRLEKTVVPEPGAFGLLLMGGLALIRRRK